ncbi:MAG: acetolactate synthase 2 catalytic subunit [Gammaproteobacteria bacterium HGW-Gammaproteobacteria-2]|nr:MAG: acetolactate synthase 2 catalytic subunit [Gammaproteobacteria bacterium HGW-Gammaproteobacteria-2]
MNAANWLVQALEAEGVDVLFGYPGGTIMPFYDALIGSRLHHVLVRHEQGAALAANGYARRSGRVGVCVATSGPGATNLVTGLADALLDSVPMVCITGQVASGVMGTDAFQELDVFGLTMPIVKHNFLVRHADELPEVVAEAFRLAREGRPGPVLIDLPKDVQLTSADHLPPHRPLAFAAIDNPFPVGLVDAMAEIGAAQRPVIYGGGGIAIANVVEEFREFVAASQIPTVVTLRALGALPVGHPLLLGMLGMHGSQAANMAVQEADLLIVVGARFDDRATGKLATFAPHARIVHLDGDHGEISKLRFADVALHGELGTSLQALCAASSHCDPWRALCAQRMRAFAARYDAPGTSIYAPALLRDLSALEPDAVVCSDVGQHQMWVAQHWTVAHPRNHLSSAGLGTMGFGLPAAIGAQLADRSARVICVSGDGGFQMNIQELATMARERLPVKIVLIDNQALGMVRQWQELFFEERYSAVDLSDNPDFCKIAEAYRIPSRSISRRDEVADALRELLASPGPMLLHVKIDQKANVWPLVPPNCSNAEMLTEETASCATA